MKEINIEDIPEGIYVNCPKDGKFKEVYIKSHCLECEHFRGLLGIEDACKNNMPFEKTFKIQCAHVMPRGLGRVI